MAKNFFASLLAGYMTLFMSILSHAQDQKAMYSKWIGTYHGTLPCADCEGIQYRISLSKDRTFVEEFLYLGKSTAIVTYAGNYNVSSNGIMSLIKSGEGLKHFRKHPDGLRVLDANAKIVDGELAHRYILKTAKHITTSKFITDKYAEQTDFYAFGDKDDWELDIAFGKKMTLKTNTDSITANLSKPDTSQEKTMVKYVAKNDSLEFRINIKKDSCRNTFTGERFNFKVEIHVKNKSDQNVQTLIGGGRKLPDFNLENKWTFRSIKGKNIKPKDYPTGVPFIQFNVHENKMSGFSGCNNFEGKISVDGNMLNCKIKPITEAICKRSKTESELYQTLAKKALTYEIEGYSIKIYDKGNVLLELQMATKE